MRSLRLSLLAAGLALGFWAEWAALRRGPLETAASRMEIRLALADLLVGVVLVGGGALAWTRRPQSRGGLLLAAAGIAWFLGTFAGSGQTAYADFGVLFITLHRGPLAHALLSYPSGRVARSERVAVAFAYVVSAIAEVGEAPVATIALAMVVLGVGLRRFAGAAGPHRRARAVAAAGSAAFAGVLLFSALTRLGGSSAAQDRGVLWAYDLVVAGVAIVLTLDLAFGRWVRATVTGLVVDLGDAAEAGTLRDRLAQALGDQSLVLGYRLADRDVYVDDRGDELVLPRENGDRRVTFVRDAGEPLAVLVHDTDVVADRELVQSVAAAARIAVVNARLHAEVRRQVEELEASRRRMIEAADGERRRLERELREHAERRLAEVRAVLDKARGRAGPELAATLAQTTLTLEATRSELREFARGIHPHVITEGGLSGALRELAARVPVPVELRVPAARYATQIEAAAYFVCSEALANVVKHAEASGATVEVAQRDDVLVVAVSDDGRGGAALEQGSGLRGLADRVEALAGRLTVTSLPDEGTQVVAELPLA